MPHKHRRKRGEDDNFDLPPSRRALPLSVSSRSQNRSTTDHPKQKKHRTHRKGNDCPSSIQAYYGIFSRNSGLEVPRIKPGEDMRSFSARVDTALPVAGLTKKTKTKDGKDSLGIKVQRTRKERKMHKLYDQWRAEERKIQEQKEEEREPARETGNKKSRKRKGKGREEDPWIELVRKRGEARIGLHDVAQAPPELHHKKTRKQLEVGGATVDVDSIPKSAGSLRRREELQTARDDVVEAYRKIREHEQAKLDAQRGKSKR
ncbi:hypothetical protein J3459_013879 [Metarhizium acridum]|nr:hypothetical protein J3459_013879 [Metarhizium acridum]